MSDTHIAIACALIASALFGIQAIAAKRGLTTTDSLTGAVITVGSMWFVYLLLTPWYLDLSLIGTTGFFIFALNGFLHPMLSMYFAIRATSQTGATLAASLTATTPIFSAIMAVALLGESVTAWITAGTVVTVAGVIIATWQPGRLSLSMRSALLFASAAALVRAINLITTRYGFEFLDSVMMAGFISLTVSFAGLLLTKAYVGPVRQVLRTPIQGVIYFGLTGLFGALGIIAMFAALKVGTVVLVAPIIAAYPLFTMTGGRLLGVESLGGRVISGCCLILIGVVIVSTA